MKQIFFLIAFALIFSGCNHYDYKTWDIDQFQIEPSALKDKEKVKVLYTSRSPNVKVDTVYTHLIVRSEETGDTVNILTTANTPFKSSDVDSVFTYFDEDNLIFKIAQIGAANLEPNSIIEQAEKTKPIRYKKVWRDPTFDHLAKNTFPSVFGVIGKSRSQTNE